MSSDILDAIDGCLRDNAVSGDAMRWSPDAEVAREASAETRSTIYGRFADAYAEFQAAHFAPRDQHWVMDLATYAEMRRESGDESDPDTWRPDPGDRLMGLPIEIRDGCGAPHVETPWTRPASLTCSCMPSRQGYGGLFIDANGNFYGAEAERLHRTHCPDVTRTS